MLDEPGPEPQPPLNASAQPGGSGTAPKPQRCFGTIDRSRPMAAARWRAGTKDSKRSHSRVWSRALIRERPQIGWTANRVMPARRGQRA